METTLEATGKVGQIVGEVMDGVDQVLPGVAKTSVTTIETIFFNADGTLTTLAILLIIGIVLGVGFGLWKALKRRASKI